MPTTNYYTIKGQIIGERPTGGTRINYSADALGSTIATLSGGAIQNTYSFKPYGSALSRTGIGNDPVFGWGGALGYRTTNRPHSDVYVRARTYSAAVGRWTSVDMLWPREAAYGYVSGNPASRTDPSGLQIPGKKNPGSPPPDCILKLNEDLQAAADTYMESKGLCDDAYNDMMIECGIIAFLNPLAGALCAMLAGQIASDCNFLAQFNLKCDTAKAFANYCHCKYPKIYDTCSYMAQRKCAGDDPRRCCMPFKTKECCDTLMPE